MLYGSITVSTGNESNIAEARLSEGRGSQLILDKDKIESVESVVKSNIKNERLSFLDKKDDET